MTGSGATSAWTVQARAVAGRASASTRRALQATYGHYRGVLAARDAELAAIEADLAHWYTHGPFADAVPRLARLPGGGPAGCVDDRQRGR